MRNFFTYGRQGSKLDERGFWENGQVGSTRNLSPHRDNNYTGRIWLIIYFEIRIDEAEDQISELKDKIEKPPRKSKERKKDSKRTKTG